MKLLYENNEFVVCVKPVGMDSEHGVPGLLKEALGGEVFTIHRLDRNVGGVMVYARTKHAAATLSTLIQKGEFRKEYLAGVHGVPASQGILEDLLFKDSRFNKVFTAKKERKGVKKARLAFRVLRSGERSIVHVLLDTGRSHQIRVQFASRGFPLVGDHKYGARDSETEPMLHSFRIRFSWGGEEKCFEALPGWYPADLDTPGAFPDSFPRNL